MYLLLCFCLDVFLEFWVQVLKLSAISQKRFDKTEILQIQVIPIVVGSGSEWEQTVVGALLASKNIEPINFKETSQESLFDEKFQILLDQIKSSLLVKEREKTEDDEEDEVRKMFCKKMHWARFP